MSQVQQKNRKEVEAEARRWLAELGGQAFHEDDIEHRGNKLIIPENMSKEDAVRYIARAIKEAEEPTTFERAFPYRPWDGAWAAARAFRKAFGSVYHGQGRGFWGPTPPQLISVPSGPNGETEQIPQGSFQVPLLSNVTFFIGQTQDEEHGVIFYLTAEGPKKYRFQVEGIFNLVEDELRQASLYRGKAFDGRTTPNFIDLSQVDRNKIVFPRDTNVQIETSIFAPIHHADELGRIGVATKRAVLVHGKFGTGKTSLGTIVGQEAVGAGWTFITCRPGKDSLSDVIRTARLYQPAVVYMEDIDVLAGTEDDGKHVSELLDMFDGIASKGSKMLLILTTNHPERIHKGMLRPGRLDALIEVGTPDAEGIAKLIQVRIPESMLDQNIDWALVAEANEGYLPAYVVEGADRAIRYAFTRTNGEVENVRFTTEDLVDAATGLRSQWTLMEEAKEHKGGDPLRIGVKDVVAQALVEEVDLMVAGRPAVLTRKDQSNGRS